MKKMKKLQKKFDMLMKVNNASNESLVKAKQARPTHDELNFLCA